MLLPAAPAFFVKWNNEHSGVIENDFCVNKAQVDDEALTAALCAYFDAGNAPSPFFVLLDVANAAGHTHGSVSAASGPGKPVFSRNPYKNIAN